MDRENLRKEKCNRPGCNFYKNPDIKNNGGTHCCFSCKQDGKHGPKCNKVLFQSSLPSEIYSFLNFDVCSYTYSIPGRKLDTIEEIFIITLTDTIERHSYIRNLFKFHNIACTVCIMNKPSDFIYDIYLKWIKTQNKTPIIPGALGCTASHYWVLTNAVKNYSSTQKIIIMEDDIYFQDNMYEILNTYLLKNDLKNVNYLLLSSSDLHIKNRNLTDNEYYIVEKHEYYVTGTIGYLINIENANRLSNIYSNLPVADNVTQLLTDKIYVAKPMLFIPDLTTSSICNTRKTMEYKTQYLKGAYSYLDLTKYNSMNLNTIIDVINIVKNDTHFKECLTSNTFCSEYLEKYDILFKELANLHWSREYINLFLKESIEGINMT